MRHFILTFSFFITFNLTFSQENEGYNFYTFQLEQITNSADAKLKIVELRKKTQEVIFYFDDDLDQFTLKTKNTYTEEELYDLLKSFYFRPVEK